MVNVDEISNYVEYRVALTSNSACIYGLVLLTLVIRLFLLSRVINLRKGWRIAKVDCDKIVTFLITNCLLCLKKRFVCSMSNI